MKVVGAAKGVLDAASAQADELGDILDEWER